MTFKMWVENNHPEFQEAFLGKLGSAISGGISGFKQGWKQETPPTSQEAKPDTSTEMDASDAEINRLIQKLEAEGKQETKPFAKRYAAEFLLRLFSVKVHEPDAYQQGEQKAAKWKKWQKEIHHALDFAGFDVVYPKRYQQFPNGWLQIVEVPGKGAPRTGNVTKVIKPVVIDRSTKNMLAPGIVSID